VCSLAAGTKFIPASEEHLNSLQQQFSHHFEKSVDDFYSACDPFGVLPNIPSSESSERYLWM
jgi:hypothetical protein